MKGKTRQRFEFPYTNEDGDEGSVQFTLAGEIRYELESGPLVNDMPLMVDFQDAPWMGEADARRFARWLTRMVKPKRWWEFWR